MAKPRAAVGQITVVRQPCRTNGQPLFASVSDSPCRAEGCIITTMPPLYRLPVWGRMASVEGTKDNQHTI